MWRSVPQMDATFTLTKTSVRPKLGTLTCRISAPGAGSGFTTANIVLGILKISKEPKDSSTHAMPRTQSAADHTDVPVIQRRLRFLQVTASLIPTLGQSE